MLVAIRLLDNTVLFKKLSLKRVQSILIVRGSYNDNPRAEFFYHSRKTRFSRMKTPIAAILLSFSYSLLSR